MKLLTYSLSILTSLAAVVTACPYPTLFKFCTEKTGGQCTSPVSVYQASGFDIPKGYNYALPAAGTAKSLFTIFQHNSSGDVVACAILDSGIVWESINDNSIALGNSFTIKPGKVESSGSVKCFQV